MSDHRIRYGMVGYGLMGWAHTLELKIAPLLRGRAKFIAAYDPALKNMERLKKKKEIKTASSFEDLLDTPNLDAVIISSPPQYHADQVVTALETGLHVYSEVPMAIEERDIERIITAEDKSGKKYQFGENYIFYSEVLYAGHLISSGKIGPAVYAESEYLHDVTYRFRENAKGDHTTPHVDSWYSLFEPMQYAHTIGPAQVILGGIDTPEPFTEVSSYVNSIGGFDGNPVCTPASSFQVALFRTETGAIAKCANAYVFAREPSRITLQVTGRTGTYECNHIGKPGRLFLAEDHMIKFRHRKGKVKHIGKIALSQEVSLQIGTYHGANPRIFDNWFKAIEKDKQPALHAKIAGNICMAGICASKSAHEKRPIQIPSYTSRA